MKKIGYIRTTVKKEIEEQSEILIAAGCSKIFVEAKESIDFKSKIKLSQMIDTMQDKETIAVTRLSILSSSVQSLLELMHILEQKKIILEVVEQNFISSGIHTLNELLFYILEFIEDIKVEKQAYAIQEAKESGKRLGRPPKLTAKEVLKAIELKQNNTSRQIANRFRVGRSTLLRHIARSRKSA